MIRIFFLTILFSFSLIISTDAQEEWSLERAIMHARSNSIPIKQTELAIRNAELTEMGNKFSRYPSVSASGNLGANFGRAIDPVSNDFTTESTIFNSFGVNASVLLYNGGRIKNSIKQSGLDLEATKLDYEQQKNDIAIQVAGLYLNIVFAEEQLNNARTKYKQTQEQLAITEKLIRAGSRPANDRYDIQASMALDEQSIIQQENNVNTGYFNLKQLLQLEPDLDIKLVIPSIPVPDGPITDAFLLQEIYDLSLQTQPQIKAAQLKLESAQLGEEIAKSGKLPVVSMGGNLSANYSNKVLDFQNPNLDDTTLELGTPVDVVINGVPAEIQQFNVNGIVFPKSPYFNQISDNFGQGVNLNIRIPLYDNHRNDIAMERARLNVLNTQMTNRLLKQTLKADVQRAIADAKAARLNYDASVKSTDAQEIAFENAEKRYKLGAINSFEYSTIQNTLDQSRVSLIIAKYDYLYKLTIVDYYKGKEITLN